jgi:hypothetical protein
MLTKSIKAKGRVLQNLTRDYILATFPLQPWDVTCAIMGENGVDVKLSEKAKEYFDFNVECKNVERLNLWESWKQATSRPGAMPLLVIKRNKSKPLVVMDMNDFFNMLKSHGVKHES